MATLRETLTSKETVTRYRIQAQDWTRQRTLGFVTVVSLILSGHKRALQQALNRVFQALGRVTAVPTASAYSQARHKLQPVLFQHLNDLVLEGFYRLYSPDGVGCGGGMADGWSALMAVSSTYQTRPKPDTATACKPINRPTVDECRRWAVCATTC